MSRLSDALSRFLALEAAGGIVLVAAAVLALVWSNSALSGLYESLLAVPVLVQVGNLIIAKSLLLWINDGLMAIFFLVVGLEIKREIVEGELSSRRQAALPGLAALGGMAGPALVYAAVIGIADGGSAALGGWAIPAATDIAFALGVLGLLGSRVPPSLKLFLLALAVIDDLGAIVIIAAFYTADLSLPSLLLAFGFVALLGLMNVAGVRRRGPYLLVGIALWVCVLKSGVHATLAGVVVGLLMPVGADAEGRAGPAAALEHDLHPWVAYAIMPIFALANAGVPLGGFTLGDLFAPIPLAIALGLFLGKQAGVLGAAAGAIRLGIAALPEGASWRQLYGVALLTGIGFTMSLFIGTLSFPGNGYMADVRVGVLAGTLLSAVAGFVVLRGAGRPAETVSPAAPP